MIYYLQIDTNYLEYFLTNLIYIYIYFLQKFFLDIWIYIYINNIDNDI